jgi:hypothetical protein
MLKAVIALLAVVGQELIPVGLQSISYDVEIVGGIAKVTLRQKYFNYLNTPVNTLFRFPSTDKAVFSSLEARFRGLTVKGLIKEKDEAKKQFETEKAKGNTVIYVDSDSSNPDIMSAKLGNFPPQETLEIALTFITPLDIMDSMYWELIIPSTLTPRYDPLSAVNSMKYDRYNSQETTYTVNQEYPWEINVDVRWPTEIGQVRCSSHPDSTNVVYTGSRHARVTFDRRELPNKDFHLIIQDKHLFKDQVSIATADIPSLPKSLPKNAALIQFIPPLYQNLIEKNNGRLPQPEEVLRYARTYSKNEFIFIVDRSGSMQGRRIELVRQTLKQILGDLPTQSYFNILSFGSSFSWMFAKSMPLSASRVFDAQALVSSFDADFGGTEILQPINSVMERPKEEGSLRTVIILTDGDVGNTRETIQACRKLRLMQGTKILTVGIGSGASAQLVRGMAEAGDGKAIFIEDDLDNEVFTRKIQNLVNEAITPFLFDFSYDFDPKYVEAVAPMLGSNNLVSPNEPFISYVLLKDSLAETPSKSTTVRISFIDPISRGRVTKVFVLKLEDELPQHSVFHKMAIYHILRSDELGLKGYYLSPELREEPKILTKLSIGYQVLSSKYTAFICVVAENTVDPNAAVNVEIASMESSDYKETNRPSNYYRRAAILAFILAFFLCLISVLL